MSLEDLGNIGEFVAAIGVIVSLLPWLLDPSSPGGRSVSYLRSLNGPNCSDGSHLSALTLNAVRQTGNVPIFEKMGFQVAYERVVDDVVTTASAASAMST